MTISPLLIYFADTVDTILTLIAWGIGLTCALFIMIAIAAAADESCHKEKESAHKSMKSIFITFIILCLLETFIPSSKTVYKMMIIPTAVNSSVVQKLPDELQQFIDKEIKVDDNK